jgi:type IV pilus assembly protein PilY1
MKFNLNKPLVSLLGLALSASALAEDIELYVNHDVDVEEKPRVLLIFDTSGSMAFSSNTGLSCGFNESSNLYIPCPDSRLAAAKTAMKKVVNDNEGIDFGLMRFVGTAGGYVVEGIGSPHSDITSSIDRLPANGGTPLAETLWEAYLYITGGGLEYAEPIDQSDRDTSIENEVLTGRERVRKCNRWRCWNEWENTYSYNYISPFADSNAEAKRCDNSVNIIYMTDGDPSPRYVYDRWGRRYINENSDNGSDASISAIHNNYFGQPLVEGDYVYNNYLHQLAKIIHGTSNTTVDLYPSTPDIHETGRIYTIGFGSGMSDEGQELLRQTALLGGGENLPASTPDELSNSLNSAISRIREVNDSFSSPSVASNNVDQTRSRDAIYFAMFYPETNTRWGGNLKKLKVSGSEIVDSEDNTALDSDGLIDTDAKTFWLPDGQSADGNLVAQGGVNYHLATLTGTPAEDRRNLYTDKQGDIVEFTTNIVSDILDLVTNNPISLASSDIKWAMGIDVDDEDNDGSNTDQRSDIFGDPLHSKPVAIDYGNDDIRILIGTNAGFLHMFKDDDTNNQVTESWAFIPSDLYDIIKPLRNEDTGKLYGMDGPISVYFSDKSLNDEGINDGIVDASDGDDVWAFAGMRRGGKNYYAFDITNPDQPKKLWDNPI